MGYFDLERLPDGAYTKRGVRGYPGLEPVQGLLLEVVSELELPGGTALDMSARGGAVALALAAEGLEVSAAESSAAALGALEAAGEGRFRVASGPVWALPGGYDLATLILPADRGNALVRALVNAAHRLLQPGGRLLVAGDKDRGFERYFKEARALFGAGEVLERDKGLRVARLEKVGDAPSPPQTQPEPFAVEARGQQLACAALPGVFSSGKLDPASRLLLEHLPSGAGRRVLDLGSGYGVLGGFLALEEAGVTLLDDDAYSAESSRLTLAANGLSGFALHSDVDAALEPNERFDLAVANPPFHVGQDLILDVAHEFVAAMGRRLEKGGEGWLVANHFLPYERALAEVGEVREVARGGGFKVLTARR